MHNIQNFEIILILKFLPSQTLGQLLVGSLKSQTGVWTGLVSSLYCDLVFFSASLISLLLVLTLLCLIMVKENKEVGRIALLG